MRFSINVRSQKVNLFNIGLKMVLIKRFKCIALINRYLAHHSKIFIYQCNILKTLE